MKQICAGQRRFGQAAWQSWYGLCTSGLKLQRTQIWGSPRIKILDTRPIPKWLPIFSIFFCGFGWDWMPNWPGHARIEAFWAGEALKFGFFECDKCNSWIFDWFGQNCRPCDPQILRSFLVLAWGSQFWPMTWWLLWYKTHLFWCAQGPGQAWRIWAARCCELRHARDGWDSCFHTQFKFGIV